MEDASLDGTSLQHDSLRGIRRLRRDGVRARTVVLKIKLAERLGPGEYRVLTRQAPLPDPSDDGAVITAAALELWERHRPGGAVRLLGVTATNIAGAGEAQLALFDDPRGTARRRLNVALDRIVGRFGWTASDRAVARPRRRAHPPGEARRAGVIARGFLRGSTPASVPVQCDGVGSPGRGWLGGDVGRRVAGGPVLE